MHKKKIIAITVILVTCSSSIFLLMGIIPLVQGKKITPYVEYTYKHYSDNAYYRLKVEKNTDYLLRLDYSGYNIQPEIVLFTRSFKISGSSSGPRPPYSTALFEFHANHNGHYYLSVLNSKGGYFSIRLSLKHHYSYNKFSIPYTSAWKLILVIFAGFLMVGSGFIFLQMYTHKSEEERKKREFTTCPSCGISCKIGIEYCTICGYTFEKPKEYKNY